MPHLEMQALTRARARRGQPLRGVLDAPGDKSVSHRALILAALARGVTHITGLLTSDDVLATARAMEALGADISWPVSDANIWTVTGCAGLWSPPEAPLDFGNSGTGVRLTMGAVAGAGIPAVFTGDESLSSRPMRRVLDPLAQMGAASRSEDGRLPVTLEGGPLTGIDYAPPIASAQVKSAILLAGLGARGETVVRESRLTRNHTETMLGLFGAKVSTERDGDGAIIRLDGPQALTATDLIVPGDPSSAAFATVAALIRPGSDITLRNVMTNPARTGLYRVLERMGADISFTPAGMAAGEAVADMRVRASQLNAIDLEPDIAPDLIDEYPILAVACAFASGVSRLRGLAELRAKESDRLAATWNLLRANGVETEIAGDDLIIDGGGNVGGGAAVETEGDHRIAMASLVLGTVSGAAVTVDKAGMIATSYPGFIRDMKALGAMIEPLG
ncbi:3-phosphoshikimate 1-carboxyvinyltransferase [Hyphobacterium sp. HN65]|uniref:3-phosphoshikimate 1-carboxyvinyltransferase n=1 Tax=Hyphobacterium lacteum TaxID=3116575 RepID=A0ABU7LSQ1_9PROT|nr:3-phosphoshikimate 1-carboxyvinyltransferase [Hyphobacterium sp. HN65]MEE2526947.1 3-phosphoshikimate 1-carboxyvinyltransferase [Hyphobacterium sp. HN65]